ncbi:8864_t:CDS:2 [Funneliformis geosporum]|uniref:8864_t:CDS:1 n=1 Tax=Funneliformis geosporum TaxID=1117311 RepID=A0A9W4WQJ5_9GLOM|nr:8864_t:CDS:2 [Funneliformis geosporum]
MNYLQRLQLDLTRMPTNDHVEIPRIHFTEFYEDGLRGLVKVLELSMRTDNAVLLSRNLWIIQLFGSSWANTHILLADLYIKHDL